LVRIGLKNGVEKSFISVAKTKRKTAIFYSKLSLGVFMKVVDMDISFRLPLVGLHLDF